MRKDAGRIIQLAERPLHADLVARHARFVAEASAARAEAVKDGASGGSGYLQRVHQLCAAELRRRSQALVNAICTAHRASGSAPSDALVVDAKDWVAKKIANEAETFGAFLSKPNQARGEKGEPDSLIDDARRECEAASAALELYWEQANRDHVDRALTWIARVWRWVRARVGR